MTSRPSQELRPLKRSGSVAMPLPTGELPQVFPGLVAPFALALQRKGCHEPEVHGTIGLPNEAVTSAFRRSDRTAWKFDSRIIPPPRNTQRSMASPYA